MIEPETRKLPVTNRVVLRTFTLLAFVLFLTGCSSSPISSLPRTPGKEIVVTTSHLEDIVAQVAGPEWQVSCIVPRGADPHVFEPSAKSLRAVTKARLLFCVGAGLEGWVEQLVKNSERPNLKVVELARGLSLEKRVSPDGGESWIDPHVWMSPKLVSDSVETIAQALVEIDPSSSSVYKKNAEAYRKELDELDAECRESFAKVPVERRRLVTSHDALGYLADRYDLEVVATVIPHVSTEAAETSAQEFQKLAELIRTTGVKAIFADQSENHKLVEQLARDSGVEVVPDLLLDSLGPRGSATETYIGTYRHNVRAFLETLK